MWILKGILWVIGFNIVHVVMEHVLQVQEPVCYSLMGGFMGILLCNTLGD